MNSVTIIGHLGNAPETKELENGNTLARFSVATNRRWVDENGDRRERTDWHRVVCFGRLAEVCDEHLTKGSHVAVRGNLRTSQWSDDDGNNRRSVEIRASEVEFLDKRDDFNTETDDDIPF